jgi:hypothetical protein
LDPWRNHYALERLRRKQTMKPTEARRAACSGPVTVRRTSDLRQDINDLNFVAELIKESGRRLVIEDFHYLSLDERTKFAFDMKALWDFGVFIVIVGVWSDQNLFLHLNTDLTARVREIDVVWSDRDLREIFHRGGAALNLTFSEELMARAIADAYGNCGILQRLISDTLDRCGIEEAEDEVRRVDDIDALEHAEIFYAEELNSVYQTFAKRVATHIRTRQNATGMYAHAMAVTLAASSVRTRGFFSLLTCSGRSSTSSRRTSMSSRPAGAGAAAESGRRRGAMVTTPCESPDQALEAPPQGRFIARSS